MKYFSMASARTLINLVTPYAGALAEACGDRNNTQESVRQDAD